MQRLNTAKVKMIMTCVETITFVTAACFFSFLPSLNEWISRFIDHKNVVNDRWIY